MDLNKETITLTQSQVRKIAQTLSYDAQTRYFAQQIHLMQNWTDKDHIKRAANVYEQRVVDVINDLADCFIKQS